MDRFQLRLVARTGTIMEVRNIQEDGQRLQYM